MGRLRNWWDRLTGRPAPAAPSQHAEPPVAGAPQPAAGLELAKDAPKRPPSRLGEAGFDPYGTDGGYAKPHSWERLDHD